MCIVYLTWGDPDWPLRLAANRDEFRVRPTAAAAPWPGHPEVVAGRDLLGGGTWLGVHARGRFAVLTNYREPGAAAPPGAPSRGALVRDFLLEAATPEGFVQQVAARRSAWAGFNLIVGDVQSAWYVGNRTPDPAPVPLAPGRHVLSNHLLDTPWPKARRLCTALDALPAARWDADPEAVFAILHDTTPAPDAELPHTGLPTARERQLSSPFVLGEDYGTRCSSVVLRDAQGRTTLREVSYDAQGRPTVRHDWPLRDPARP